MRLPHLIRGRLSLRKERFFALTAAGRGSRRGKFPL